MKPSTKAILSYLLEDEAEEEDLLKDLAGHTTDQFKAWLDQNFWQYAGQGDL
jgi:hypothetical protein